jgi:phosphopantothenoylcysteine decarboxylase/phosphopantothenate--cysteine ligase
MKPELLSAPESPWRDRRILLGIGGGIAAYKICEVASTLAKGGAEIRSILTQSAQQFITPLTFSTLCRHPAYTDSDFWHPIHPRPLHIELGEWAEVFLLAPLTANTLAKLAYGLADNLLTNTVLASRCPLLLAPAMNTEMWQQLTVQQNWQQVQANPRIHTIEPTAGILACDRIGQGRMAEPVRLLDHLQSLLQTQGKRDLVGRCILVTAGGTQEYLDPVRFIGNPATGRMGLALALAAHHRGASVTLVHGTWVQGSIAAADLPFPTIPITQAAQMQAVLQAQFPSQDWLIMAAAVADVRPARYSATKLPKAQLPEMLPLEPVPDLVAELAQQKQPHQRLIGFAAQTGDIVAPALEKLHRKGLDAIVANPIDQPHSGFGSEFNQAVFLDRTGRQQRIPPCTKLQIAHRLLDFVMQIENLN